MAFVTISEFETDKQTWQRQGGSFELDPFKNILDNFQQYNQTCVQGPPSGPEKKRSELFETSSERRMTLR